MSIYELFDKGLTESEFNLAKQNLLDDIFEQYKVLNEPLGSKNRRDLDSKIRKLRVASYRKYFECTHIMTPEGIKIK